MPFSPRKTSPRVKVSVCAPLPCLSFLQKKNRKLKVVIVVIVTVIIIVIILAILAAIILGLCIGTPICSSK